MKKIYSLLLVLLMAVMGVNTAKAMEIMDSGDGWRVEKDYDYEHYYLIITNKNAMKNYSSASAVPWHDWRPYIWSVSFDRSSFTGTRNVGAYCFCDMPLLSSACIADIFEENIDNVTIGAHAFENCPNLKGLSGDRFIKSIGDYAFSGCTSIWGISWSESLNKIGAHAFDGCTTLDLANTHANAFTVGEYAFYGCSNLPYVDLSCATSIGDYAFKNSNMRYITLTNCQTIGKYAFHNCSLETITFGSSLWSIGEFAFWNGIENNAHIYVTGTPPSTMGTGVFSGVNCSTVTLDVPESLGNAYNVDPWNQFNRTAVGTKIYGVYNGTTLTLYYDGSMISRGGTDEWWTWHYADQRDATTKIVLDASMDAARPESTAGWFLNFESLTQIDHFDRLHTEKVEDMNSMFYNCKSLASIDLSRFSGASATNMSGLFANCESLTELDVNYLNMANVTLTNSMFYKCKNLERIYCESDWSVYSSQITADANMFFGCVKLTGGKGTAYDANNVGINFARPDGGPDAPGYFWRADDDGLNHEGIDNVQSDKVQGTKVIRDGMLLIERNGKTFNALGVEVR